MTRKGLLEIIRHRFKPGDNTSQFNLLYIEAIVDSVWEELAFGYIKGGGEDSHYYTKVYPSVSVALDANIDMYTATIPEKTVRDGVIRIYQATSKDNDFVPISERDFRVMHSLEVYQIGGKIYYYTTYDTVYFGESMTSAIAAAGVYMDLLIPFSKYDIDEELPLPQAMQVSFLDAVLSRLNGTPIVQLKATNSD